MAQSSSEAHKVAEVSQPKSYEWINQDKISLSQQAQDPMADNVETAQEEEDQDDKDGDDVERDAEDTVDNNITLAASAPPGELGIMKKPKEKKKVIPGELGIGPKAPAAAPAPAPVAPKGIPAELGFAKKTCKS
jgi:hypothetical protein